MSLSKKLPSFIIVFAALFILFYGFYVILNLVDLDSIYSYVNVDVTEIDETTFNDAGYFIQYGYPEIKGLSIRLLTLLSAILVFSITFSEKIVKFSEANHYARLVLFISWTFFILAIVSDGFGLAFNGLALPYAITDNHSIKFNKNYSADFYEFSANSILCIIFSGFLFIVGMVCILISGILANINPRKVESKG
ncbi:MAG: hypothetical protein N4A46_05915 [Schleiferiaceae bacterium]|jgi:hypothetical protein|nr:hypothetical protein [Schleiferiaceae bacterium]